MKKNKGFTLLELLVVIMILAIISMIAAPVYSKMVERSRMRAVIGEWRSAFYLAQSEAIRLKHRVIICASSDGKTCKTDSKQDYSDGWIVYNQTENRLVQDFPPIDLRGDNQRIKVRVSSNQDFYFLPNGRLNRSFSGGSVIVSSQRYSDMSNSFNISRAGRISQRNNP